MKLTAAKLKAVALIVLAMWSITGFAQGGIKMYVMRNGAIVFQSPVSGIDSIVFKQTANDDNCQSFDNPQGVVINGVRWATRNVGAPGTFASSPCDYGEYYQFNKGTSDFMSYSDYWNSDYANSDTWLPDNDPSPAGWRVPTFDEIKKLLDINCVTCERIGNNGLIGEKFTDKSTGNTLFLPAAGGNYDSDGVNYNAGDTGMYWCSSTVDKPYVYCLGFFNNGGTYVWSSYYGRYGRFSVRPVAK